MRKLSIIVALAMVSVIAKGQNIQAHYDFRHSIDPRIHSKNFPVLVFEYFKEIDTVGTGAFLLKTQIDLTGERHNVGQVFTQISQSLRFWKPKIFLYINYSGGLGVGSDAFGFYVANSFGLGLSYPFQWRGAWISTSLSVRYTAYKQSTYDPQMVLYFGRGFRNYRFLVAGSFVLWTENRDQGVSYTAGQSGKKVAFFGDPQIWIKIAGKISIGSRMNVFYHLITDDHRIQIYPTLGARAQF